jgi:glyceraldehyde 3-phosphate dehydrogenase
MSIKIAINGFGRIGRPVFRRILDSHPNLEVVAINDLTDNKTLAHLLKYDSLYGIYHKPVKYTEEALIVNGQEFKCLAEKEPANLPWKELGIDIVLECTGRFTDLEEAKKHIQAGAKKVIISAPSKNSTVPHFVLGVNEEKYNPEKDDVVSMCSCTTNCLAPIAKILHENFEIESGLMTTIHSYTNDQRLLDLPHRDLRRARAAALSMVPTTTGAAIAVTKTIPELKGKIHGLAIRVPTPVVSLVDFVAKVKKETSVEEVNYIFKKASSREELKGILGIEDALLVSVDYRGNSFSSIVDMASTMVQGENLVKVLAWYDNEWGYACRLAEFTEYVGSKL